MSTLSERVLDQMIERIESLTALGMTLSSETDPIALQEATLLGVKALTNADGGTIYSVDQATGELHFVIMRTDSLGIAMGGADGDPIDMPTVPLHTSDGAPNLASVVARSVLEGATINLPDAYHAAGFDFSGTRAFDRNTGYRTKSVLTIPMRDHEGQITGVLQLLNARGGSSDAVIPFSTLAQRMAESLASQAAIALNRQRLITDLNHLFESFVTLIADAIDAKSPYTGRHCRQVPVITMMLAEAAVAMDHGPMADFAMSEADRYELHIASLLHDCGKITTPEWVMDKATKLETIHDRIEDVKLRYQLLRQEAEVTRWRDVAKGGDPAEAEQVYESLCAELDDEVAFLEHANRGSEFMPEGDRDRVRQIAAERTWPAGDGERRPMLDADEVLNLTIAKGTLTQHEREVINHHIVATIQMLERLPYPRHLQRVPEFAGGHHERMDGKGYPRGLTREQMSVQARIMGIADIFEALTASDRPYKPAMPLSQTLKILGRMAEDGHIDPDLFQVFIEQGVWREYAEAHLKVEQRDQVDLEHLPGLGGTRRFAPRSGA